MNWNFLFNIVVNSFFSFFTIALFTKLLLIKFPESRLKVYLLTLPFLKLLIDPFLYDFSTWALIQNVDPTLSEVGSRALTIALSFETLLRASLTFYVNELTFSIADLFLKFIDPFFVKLGTTLILFTSLLLCIRKALLLYFSHQELKRIIQRAELIDQIYYSDEIAIPCATKSALLFPKKFVPHLKEEEFSAIVAHEKSHIQFKDIYLTTLLEFISLFFWWIPTKRWLLTCKESIEKACDKSALKNDLTPHHLASAILKSVHYSKDHVALPVMCFVQKKRLKSRLDSLFKPKTKKALLWIQTLLFAPLLSALLIGKLWIF